MIPAHLPLPSMTPEEELAKKSGGKTVEELTKFCRFLSEKEKAGDEDEIVNKPVTEEEDGEGPFIHHPFKVKATSTSIVMNIKLAAQKAELSKQFPVSSGSQHRIKELEWVPVEKDDKQKTKGAASSSSALNISAIVGERVKALRQLQANPYDVEAMSKIHKAQQQIQNWAVSSQIPGQFTGTTGVQLLSTQELANTGNQAWAKKDMFQRLNPVQGGMGMQLMKKMGWKPGEGLGKGQTGVLEPLTLDVKTDRRGLLAQGEKQGKKSGPVPVIKDTTGKDLSGKHPVSALMEICNKRKWMPPEFVLVHDSGPDHKKNFLFKVLSELDSLSEA
uniref:G-patch domain-containing protein n=1 Tax=Branchiostoma floridae TaxID=7739 RepID=C3XTK1_BRAFL|eukprot:XP_002612618.1 hypothetical protein BRAFLDRAFT_219680 [Branchiostoma floridae]